MQRSILYLNGRAFQRALGQGMAGAKGITYEKCPTLLEYEQGGLMRWGLELDRTTEGQIETSKLLLDPKQPRSIDDPDVSTNTALEELGKAPIEAVTDYICAIFRHATDKIDSKYPKGYFRTLKKQYVLTVPAI